MKEKVKQLNLEKNVMFLGQRNDANELYQAMDVFVLPSLYEGLGMVAIEAQVSDLYVFCSTEVPKEAKITDEITFLELDKEIWKEKILSIKSFDRENIDLKNTNYDIHTESKKLEKIYIKLISNLL